MNNEFVKIKTLLRSYFRRKQKEKKFIPGQTWIQYAGAVFDQEEASMILQALLDGWLGMGKYCRKFEADLSSFLGIPYVAVVNSGSSANLLAISAVMEDNLEGGLKPGDEVITPAATFPTTLNPIIQNQLVPTFVDIELGSYNVTPDSIKSAIGSRTKAIFLPHTLGNPFDVGPIIEIAEKKELMLIEDACDALGSKFRGRFCGTFGIAGTFSFYPAHHITTGEGGAVISEDPLLIKNVQSLRDWGRACVMPVCSPRTCGMKNCPRSFSFDKEIPPSSLPMDYDKRYTYEHLGYNLKPTELQGAMGVAQLTKLPNFIEIRKRNFHCLFEEFMKYEDYFILPKWLPESDPSWFAFPITIKQDAHFNRYVMMKYLAQRGIETKLLFAGNILRHPAYHVIQKRIAEPLYNSDVVTERSFFIGLYPRINENMINYIAESVEAFMREHEKPPCK